MNTQERIITALQLAPMTVTALSSAISMSQQNLNLHLKALRASGLVECAPPPSNNPCAGRVWRSTIVEKRGSHRFRSAPDGEECLCQGCKAAGLGEDAWLPCTTDFWDSLGGYLVYGACKVCRAEALAARRARNKGKS